MTASNGQRRSVLVALGMVATALVTTSAAAAPPRETLTSTVQGVVGLAGTETTAVDVDGTLVVGDVRTSSGQHAYAYDLATSAVRDLGTLGGRWARVTALDGAIVVGVSETASREQHAFAFDLSEPAATMRDLGTLGGTTSAARDVSGHVVVGESSLSPYGTRAFVFDLAAPGATMRPLTSPEVGSSRAIAVDGDLVVGGAARPGSGEEPFLYDLATSSMHLIGTLGGRFGMARAVSGNLVVGDAETAAHDMHAFVYDAGAAGAVPRDLGTPAGHHSIATTVEGSVVAGSMDDSDGTHHVFAYDLAAAKPRLRDLGSLGGRYAVAEDIAGQLVVGGASRAGDQRMHAFAYDLAASDARMVDLGVPAGSTTSGAAAVSGRTVVGTADLTLGKATAAVWTVRSTTEPVLRFGRTRYGVHESSGRVSVTVVRAGDPTRPVSVGYATTGITARAGQDFATRSGTIRFAPGQTSRTLTVPVLSDRRMEKTETVMMRLSSPRGGALLGTPNVAAVLIRASDQRPDTGMDVRRRSDFFGNNVYSSTGVRQTKRLAVRPGTTRALYAVGQNDGNDTNLVVLRAGAAPRGLTTRYYDADTGADVTARLRSSRGWRVSLEPRQRQFVRVQVTTSRSARTGTTRTLRFSCTWRGDVTRVDVARAALRVVR